MSSLTPDNNGFQSNQIFDWIDDMPAPRYGRAIQKEQVQQLIHSGLSLPYRGVWNPDTRRYEMEDPRFEGATCAEVMVIKMIEKAAMQGDAKATEGILDRILGKPKQAVESVSMQMSYAEFLEQSARQPEAKDYFPTQYDFNDTIDVRPHYEEPDEDAPEDQSEDDLYWGV